MSYGCFTRCIAKKKNQALGRRPRCAGYLVGDPGVRRWPATPRGRTPGADAPGYKMIYHCNELQLKPQTLLGNAVRPNLSVFLLIGCLMLCAQPVWAEDAAGTLRKEIEKGLARGMPSISVAIATRQGVIWSGALGYADLPSRSRAHPGYLYGVGSIT